MTIFARWGPDEPTLPAREALVAAFGHGSYLLLVAGFFVCGFHLAFITTHLPAHGAHAAGPGIAAWALAVIGLANVAGSYTAGVLGGRRSKRKRSSSINTTRRQRRNAPGRSYSKR